MYDTNKKSFWPVRALVAQMVERKTLNLVVVGSSPTEGAYFFSSQNQFLEERTANINKITILYLIGILISL